ncbi:hydroxyacylglutathione hydrolase [Rhodoblastus sp.]|uniref:hydroxyacylglutathione hydrolase n=1 Tax=Rhodoblastus sp. TaxID=1962975 RepID=UPI0035ADF289
MAIEFHQFLCLQDNFGLLAHDPATGATAALDAPDAEPILAALAAKGWGLTDIWLTHHHDDHIQGVAALKAHFANARVVGARKDAARLPPLDLSVVEGDIIQLGAHNVRVLETPGHTLGHLAYYFVQQKVAVVGDTLFGLGCGRVFEGTMPMMYESLMKLASLPDETRVYCGHEYTQANAAFALAVDPDNAILLQRVKEIDSLRASGKFTVPTSIGIERATNPFLRADNSKLQSHLGFDHANPVDVFAELRERKNHF